MQRYTVTFHVLKPSSVSISGPPNSISSKVAQSHKSVMGNRQQRLSESGPCCEHGHPVNLLSVPEPGHLQLSLDVTALPNATDQLFYTTASASQHLVLCDVEVQTDPPVVASAMIQTAIATTEMEVQTSGPSVTMTAVQTRVDTAEVELQTSLLEGKMAATQTVLVTMETQMQTEWHAVTMATTQTDGVCTTETELQTDSPVVTLASTQTPVSVVEDVSTQVIPVTMVTVQTDCKDLGPFDNQGDKSAVTGRFTTRSNKVSKRQSLSDQPPRSRALSAESRSKARSNNMGSMPDLRQPKFRTKTLSSITGSPSHKLRSRHLSWSTSPTRHLIPTTPRASMVTRKHATSVRKLHPRSLVSAMDITHRVKSGQVAKTPTISKVTKRRSLPVANLTSQFTSLARQNPSLRKRSSSPNDLIQVAVRNRLKFKKSPKMRAMSPMKSKTTKRNTKATRENSRSAKPNSWKTILASSPSRPSKKNNRRVSDVTGLKSRLAECLLESTDADDDVFLSTKEKLLMEIDHNAYCNVTSREVRILCPKKTQDEDCLSDDFLLQSFSTPLLRHAVPEVTLVTEHHQHVSHTAYFPDADAIDSYFNCGLDPDDLLRKMPTVLNLNLPGVTSSPISPIDFVFKFGDQIKDYHGNPDQKLKDILESLAGSLLDKCGHVTLTELALITKIKGLLYRVDPNICVKQISPMYQAHDVFQATVVIFNKESKRVDLRCISC